MDAVVCIVWLLDSGVSQHQVCMNKVGFRKLRAGGEEQKLMEFIKSQITIHYMYLISGIFPILLARLLISRRVVYADSFFFTSCSMY